MSATFLKHFNSITNPRIEGCKKHELIDIALLAISALATMINIVKLVQGIGTRTCQQLLIDKSWLTKLTNVLDLKSVIQVTAQVHDKSAGRNALVY
jgi:hypothetical protein